MFPIHSLHQHYPPIDVATKAQRKAAEAYEKSQRDNPGEAAHKATYRRVGVALANLSLRHFPPVANTDYNVLLLDGYDLLCTRELLENEEVSAHITNVLVPNYQAGLIAKRNPGLNKRVKLFGLALQDLVYMLAGDVVFRVMRLDICSNVRTNELAMLKAMFQHCMFDTTGPTMLDITFLAAREAKVNRPLLANAEEGVDRLETLRDALIRYALETGNDYSIVTHPAMQRGWLHHQMQTGFFFVVPKEVSGGDHAKMTRFLQAIGATVEEARKDPAVAPPPKDKGEMIGDDDDDDEAVASAQQKRQRASAKRPAKAKKPRVAAFRVGQAVEINFHNWEKYPGSQYSRLPCEIVSLSEDGKEATVKPLLSEGLPAEVHRKRRTGETYEDFVVPLERVELPPPPPARPYRITDFVVGQRVETAWRPSNDGALTWWAGTIVSITRNPDCIHHRGDFAVRVRGDDTVNEMPVAWCRPMKE